MVVQQVVPFLRVLIFLLPVYSGLAVVGLAGLIDWAPRWPARRWRRLIFVTATLVVVSVGAAQLYTRQPPRGLFSDLPKTLDGLRPLLAEGEPIGGGYPAQRTASVSRRARGLTPTGNP